VLRLVTRGERTRHHQGRTAPNHRARKGTDMTDTIRVTLPDGEVAEMFDHPDARTMAEWLDNGPDYPVGPCDVCCHACFEKHGDAIFNDPRYVINATTCPHMGMGQPALAEFTRRTEELARQQKATP
jgi:hypothetical protein